MTTIIDLAIIGIFFLIVFLIGIIDRKHVTIEDYWVNNRKTKTIVLITTIVSTFVGAGAILGNASVAFTGGGLFALVIPASFFLYLFLFGTFFAPKVKEFGDKFKAYTLPDFLEHRYSGKVRLAGSITNLITYSLSLALHMLANGILVATLTGINATFATIIGGLIVIAYTTIGGLRADIRTDIFQFFVMIVLLIILLPLTILKAGGLNAISSLPKEFLAGTLFAPPYVFALAFLFIGATIFSSSDIWQRTYASDSKRSAKKAMIIGSVIVLLFIAMGTTYGIFGKILFPAIESNMVIPELLKLLPVGLFGLVLAGFFAAIMSSADTILLITSMTIVHDIYQKSFKKIMLPSEKLKISRWVTLIAGILSLAIALMIFNIVHLSIESISFTVVLIPAIIFGFYWKKATSNAAFWSILVGLIAVFAFLFIDPVQAFIPGIVLSFLTFFIVNAFSKK